MLTVKSLRLERSGRKQSQGFRDCFPAEWCVTTDCENAFHCLGYPCLTHPKSFANIQSLRLERSGRKQSQGCAEIAFLRNGALRQIVKCFSLSRLSLSNAP